MKRQKTLTLEGAKGLEEAGGLSLKSIGRKILIKREAIPKNSERLPRTALRMKPLLMMQAKKPARSPSTRRRTSSSETHDLLKRDLLTTITMELRIKTLSSNTSLVKMLSMAKRHLKSRYIADGPLGEEEDTKESSKSIMRSLNMMKRPQEEAAIKGEASIKLLKTTRVTSMSPARREEEAEEASTTTRVGTKAASTKRVVKLAKDLLEVEVVEEDLDPL
jgi:hypothetical protein